jgi:diguanylate cyclase (GGDEF)-like protein
MRLRHLFTPSFRNRLRLFFVVIVIIPMIAVGLVLFRLVSTSQESQTDAQLGKAQQVAANLYETSQQRADSAAMAITRDAKLVAAIRARDATTIQRRLDETTRATRAVRAQLKLEREGTFEAGRSPAVAPARKRLVDQDSRPLGELVTSVDGAADFAALVSRLAEVEVIVGGREGVLAATLPTAGRQRLPARGSATVDGVDYRATSFPVPAFDGGELTLRLLIADPGEGGLLGGTSLLVLGVLLGFLILAFAFALTVSRTLQAEIKRLLDAAGALGKGDFSVAVSAEGNDEFARLGKEFNSMARQLEARLEELQRERTRLQEAIRRVGESFAAGLDRVNLLEIVVQTAVDGIGADAGRATMRRDSEERLQEVARTGDPQAFERALHAAEAAVMDAGQMAEIQLGGASALAAPLGAPDDSGGVVGIVSLARAAGDFTLGERELFSYLTNQASLSVENVDLHETVQRQAVTDELTGLFNHRRFQEVMASEVERARRYGHQMGLIMLDLDNFKRVNDTYGHMQGDLVLREVARVLRQSSREIDEPARYGGEEMAVALPQTDIEGAYRFAERVRRRIEALELPLLDGDGSLRVTASFGAASLEAAREGGKDALVAAADAALYRAKRSGKNRTVRAE